MLWHDPMNLHAFKNEGGRRGFCRFECGIHRTSNLKMKGPMPQPIPINMRAQLKFVCLLHHVLPHASVLRLQVNRCVMHDKTAASN